MILIWCYYKLSQVLLKEDNPVNFDCFDFLKLMKIKITFKEVSSSINPESINSQIEPERQNLLQFGHDLGVTQVQIWLFWVELVKVVLPAFLVQSPSWSSEHTSLKLAVQKNWVGCNGCEVNSVIKIKQTSANFFVSTSFLLTYLDK